MLYSCLCSLILFAQEQAKDGEKSSPGQTLFQFLPILLIGIVFYFMILGPGRRQRQEQSNLLKALKKNDEVVMQGGIIGVVLNLKEGTDEITIKSDETKLRMLKSAVARVIPAKDSTETK
ncbi:MAG: preprotein translocase subunit YajC [Planctomycetes bacterium]|nr:preprotein translocase subunit YajC [Planctomycetota bacterium]